MHKTYLFICQANVNRSRTAEDFCRRYAEHHGLPIEARSAGLSPLANTPLTQALADQADLIFVMEAPMKRTVETRFGQPPSKVICLDIPDEFERGDVLLIRLLRDALLPYLA